eukprot:IDg2840t1
MDVTVSDQELAMTILSAIPTSSNILLLQSMLCRRREAEYGICKVRLLQEEQRMNERVHATTSVDSVLVSKAHTSRSNRQVPVCTYCDKRGHTEPKCWQKYGRPGKRDFHTI